MEITIKRNRPLSNKAMTIPISFKGSIPQTNKVLEYPYLKNVNLGYLSFNCFQFQLSVRIFR
jgi:hypothetical protein